MKEMRLQFEEFESLTGMFPDILTYEAAELEYSTGDWTSYSTGDWASKVEFCEYVKADKDGLARKIQRIANDRWDKSALLIQRLIKENDRLRDENDRLRDENDSLCDEKTALSDHVQELNDKINRMPDIRKAMFCAESEMMAEFSHRDIGVAHAAFGYLLEKLEAENASSEM